jgi:hypothetical protein
MLQIEAQLGDGMLASRFTSRALPLPEPPTPTPGTATPPRTLWLDWRRCLPLVRGPPYNAFSLQRI